MTSFLWPAVDFCPSRNSAHICVRKAVSGVSSGISTYGVDMRDAVDARVELGVCADALRETAVDDLADLVADTLPGIVIYIYGGISTFVQ
jgi:hypothetical protein